MVNKKPNINIIAAIGKNRELGKNNKLLWKISADLKHFKELTMGHPIIMGRKTFESIGKALPGRTNIVVTRNPTFTASGCLITHTLDSALEKALEIDDSVFIIGGQEIFERAIEKTDRLYLTRVDDEKSADVFFPDYSTFKTIISAEEHKEHDPPFCFIVLEK
ncbi:dihydrofolate reductase [Candidatus Parcubacteria bacterium]|nr:dihydrofolate reductase [Candidatus Parcubacteria bacterium]